MMLVATVAIGRSHSCWQKTIAGRYYRIAIDILTDFYHDSQKTDSESTDRNESCTFNIAWSGSTQNAYNV